LSVEDEYQTFYLTSRRKTKASRQLDDARFTDLLDGLSKMQAAYGVPADKRQRPDRESVLKWTQYGKVRLPSGEMVGSLQLEQHFDSAKGRRLARFVEARSFLRAHPLLRSFAHTLAE
jgi:hypothetical protein